jgi:DNA-binding transcriptional MerR regulator/methylmalonyl-CoA mutase cobalamin-binding subunit
MSPYAEKSIADVERETGLPRATIRIWERRYGFPAPVRDERGERRYPAEQIEQLQRMARLVERGHRPARLLQAGEEEIRRLHEDVPAAPARRPKSATRLLRLLKQHDAKRVCAELAGLLRATGLAGFAGTEVPAMNAAVGEAWLAGELEVHEEHLYCDCLYELLRPEIGRLEAAVRTEAPTVLLTTFPQEPHGLGLLMAHAFFALQGCRTVSLGVRLPLEQIASACRAYRADLLGLTFTGCVSPNQVLRGLEELRGSVAQQVRIWAGGAAPVLARRAVTGVRCVQDVRDIPALLAEDFALAPR